MTGLLLQEILLYGFYLLSYFLDIDSIKYLVNAAGDIISLHGLYLLSYFLRHIRLKYIYDMDIAY